MAILFVSYGRAIQEKVRALTQDLESLGHEVWFDQALAGGQAWWDQVLANIRACDVFVFALAPASLESPACRLEYAYANALGKIVLPVLVADGVAAELLPPALAKIQYVDCRSQDKLAVVGLVRAFASLPPPPPLPDPLPQAPGAPLSYLGSLSEEVQSAAKLSFEQQTALVLRLKQGIKAGGDGRNERMLLQRFRARDDLYARVADEIDELLKTPDEPDTSRARRTAAADSPQTQRRDMRLSDLQRDVVRTVPLAGLGTGASRPDAGSGNAVEWTGGALSTCLFAAAIGVVVSYLFPAIVLETLNRSYRSAPVVFVAGMVLGLLPALAAQLALLRKRGLHALAGRWKGFVTGGWVTGAIAGVVILFGGMGGMIHILVFGAAGGGVGALIVLMQAHLHAKSKLRKITTAT